jgi:pyridoxamine 5'-phosphate oxidase
VLLIGLHVLCPVRTAPSPSRVQDLRANPACELCWFFPLSKEQYRVTGRAVLIDDKCAAGDAKLSAVRLAQWSSLVIPTRQLFDAAPPGTARKAQAMGDLDRYEAQPIDPNVPSPNFVVVLLQPSRYALCRVGAGTERAR